MANSIDAEFAQVAQNNLDLFARGFYLQAHDQYTLLMAGLFQRYTRNELDGVNKSIYFFLLGGFFFCLVNAYNHSLI